MIIQLLQNTPLLRKIMYSVVSKRANMLIINLNSYLKKNDKILDIGAGNCAVTEQLRSRGYKITPLDIINGSFVDNITPIIYDGSHIPFKKKTFNVTLLLTVLHHIPQPEIIVKEAQRVSDRIIIVEDIYENTLHKYVTFLFDSIVNAEFIGHPHSNKSDREWKLLFQKLGLRLVHAQYRKLLIFTLATYYVENCTSPLKTTTQ